MKTSHAIRAAETVLPIQRASSAAAADRRGSSPGRPRAWVVAQEIAIALLAYLLYFLVRGLTEGDPERARANAARIVHVERGLRIFWEEDLQGLVASHHSLVDGLNAIYIWGHWPVIGAVALWLLLKHPVEYRVIRNGFLISGAIGLLIFATFPVAPPRLLDLGFADTVAERTGAYRALQPGPLVNQFAAMPSLHFGWNLLIGIALVRYAQMRTLRVAGLILPMAMAAAVILTANHFILDVIAGGGLALLGLWLAEGRPSSWIVAAAGHVKHEGGWDEAGSDAGRAADGRSPRRQ